MDVCKIAPGLYHYVAVDDCTRYRVLGIFPRRSAAHTVAFLERVLEEMPFPIQRVQTDRGREFFALRVQPWLKDAAIKFRPTAHSSLGGKTPIDRVCELSNQTPLPEEVDALYSEENEPVRHSEYALDIALRKLKRSLGTPQLKRSVMSV
jgi:Integrase core domain